MTRAAVSVFAGALAVGALLGWVWALLAPGVRYQVFANQSWAPLPTETQHIFVAFGMFAVIGLFYGGAVATVGWLIRDSRGALMLLVCAVSAAVGTLVSGRLGVALAGGVDPASVAATAGAQEVVAAPAVLTGWPAYLAAPLAAVVVYTFLASWNGLHDLGRARL